MTGSAYAFEELPEFIASSDALQVWRSFGDVIPPAVFAARGAMPQITGVHSMSDQGEGPTSVTPITNPGVPPPSLHVFFSGQSFYPFF